MQLAEALEDLHGAGNLAYSAEIAFHWYESNLLTDTDKLIEYACLSGQAALRACAFEDAVTLFELGLSPIGGKRSARNRANMLFGLGKGQAALLRYEKAIDNLSEAFNLYAELGDIDAAVAVASTDFSSFDALIQMLELRKRAMQLLQKEAELQEIVQLVGPDALPPREQIVLEGSRMIREDFLQQNAFHDVDTYCPSKKQIEMLRIILSFYDQMDAAVQKGGSVERMKALKTKEDVARMATVDNMNYPDTFRDIENQITEEIGKEVA